MRYIGFGAGSKLNEMNPDFFRKLAYIVDNDPQKYDCKIHGAEIRDVEILRKESPDNIFIIVLSELYYAEISMQLMEMGFAEKRHYIRVADWVGNQELPDAYRVTNSWHKREQTFDMNNEHMEYRKKLIARFIDPCICGSVADFGCGNMSLEKYLPASIVYCPIDYVKRDARTIVADFNSDDFPEIKVDCAVLSGVLMYIHEWQRFLCKVMNSCSTLIISYHLSEVFSNVRLRREKGYINAIRLPELILYIQSKGFILADSCHFRSATAILKFQKL